MPPAQSIEHGVDLALGHAFSFNHRANSMTNQNPTVTPTETPQQLSGVAPRITSAITAMCPLGGYLWTGCQDGSLYRIRPNPLEVLQILPQQVAATRDGAADQTFEFQRAFWPALS